MPLEVLMFPQNGHRIAANAIYSTLVSYTNTGQRIWTTSNVAKYNDYVLYNTTTGDAPATPPVV